MTTEKIIDKLRKLIEHRNSAQEIGSIAEAEAFTAKITQLLTDHKLEMSDVQFNKEIEEEIERDYLDFADLGIPITDRKDVLLGTLAHIVAKANFCRIIYATNQGNKLFIVGKKTDRQVTSYIFQCLYQASRRMAEMEYRKLYYIKKCQGLQHEMKGFKKSWLHGFNLAIADRLKKQKEEQVYNETQALVLANAGKAVNIWIQNNMRVSPLHSSINATNHTARERGYDYGKSVSINQALNSAGKPARRLN